MKKAVLFISLVICLLHLEAQQFDSITDNRDGQKYRIVKLGNHWWMAENLNYYTAKGSLYANNDSITNADLYRRLYLWETAINSCPSGWHVPTHAKWRTMEMVLGFEQNEPMNGNNLYGSDEGGKLKESDTAYWLAPNEGATNTSGFNALPGGHFFNKTWGYGDTAHF